MGLVAIDEKTGERIEADLFESSHQINAKYDKLACPCPDCQIPVFPRSRKGFVLHFVHRSVCKTQYGHHPESLEHLLGKRMVASQLKQEASVYTDADIVIEHPLPDAGTNGRIADVALVYPSGNLLIGEVQLASITSQEMEQRTNDYASIGADVIWFVGKTADTPDNRHWCLSNFGVYYRLNFIYEEISLEEFRG